MRFQPYFPILILIIPLFSGCGPESPDDQGKDYLSQLNSEIQKKPDQPALYLQRAGWYLENEQNEPAIADLEQVLRLDSSRASTYHLLAETYLQNAQSREAIHVLERGWARFPDTLETGLKLAYYQHVTRQYEESLRTLGTIRERSPQNADVYFIAGLNFQEMGDTGRAVNSFQEAVELDPTVQGGDAYIILGELNAALGNSVAERYFDNAVSVAPENDQAYFAKANYLADQNRLEEALGVYRDLVAIDPFFAPAYYNSGLLYLDLDSLPQARKQFDLAVNTSPTYVEAYYYRGVTSEMMGQNQLALADYEQVLRLDPGVEEAREAVLRLQETN